ncbi:MAG: hypothetical protein PUK59_00095 [Actinomycetaceae bacterium]|nr:hypothetical protein [Actinomycetaceae bacterium]MDY5854236.1 hypothetical protein [Arcanobacterium sp.]
MVANRKDQRRKSVKPTLSASQRLSMQDARSTPKMPDLRRQ